MGLFRRRKRRLREIGESEAYGRAYGDRSEQVKVVKLEPRRPRYQLKVSGETLRRADDILVLADGQIVEYARRDRLIADETSRFAQLLRAGSAEVLG